MWPFNNSKFENEVKGSLNTIIEKLGDFETKLLKIQRQGVQIMNELEALQAQNTTLIANVAAESDVVTSVVTAINGLTATQAELIQKLNDAIAAGSPVAIQEVADSMAAQNQIIVETTQKLADAVATIPAV
jgi:hypothetical protein